MRATAMVLFLYDPCGASSWARLSSTPRTLPCLHQLEEP